MLKNLAAVGIVLMLAGCATVNPCGECATGAACAKCAKEAAGGTTLIVVEVEEFTLTGADVQKLAGAGGGKVAVLLGESSKAEKTIKLSTGTYIVTVYAQGTSSEEDAFYLTVGNEMEERLYPDDVGEILPVPEVTHVQKADGPCKIAITFAEENVLLDRVEFERVQ